MTVADPLMTDRFFLFWGAWPSQWFKADFTLGGITYNCCEQYMMAEKARVFGDLETCGKILGTRNPRDQKALGRKVRNFDADTWNDVCRGIVYAANLAKFEQNSDLARLLLDTGSRTIVEASPTDRIWGIGLASSDPRAQDPAQWQGTNWLGVALMQVRDELLGRAGRSAMPLDPNLKRQLDRREEIRIAQEV